MRFAYLQKLKRPDGRAVWGAYPLGRDEHGCWLFTPAGSAYRGERAGVVGHCEVGQGEGDRGRSVLHLVPSSGWWLAAWTAEPDHVTVSVDVCTPPRRDGHVWTYTDLELDVFSPAPGTARVDDRDEFDEACDRGYVSELERAQATAAVARLEHLLTACAAPFGDTGRDRLAHAGALRLPPVTELPDADELPEPQPRVTTRAAPPPPRA